MESSKKPPEVGGFDLYVYALTPRRDLQTLERFIGRYADRAASSDRGTEAVLYRDESGREVEERTPTLDRALAIGLAGPRRRFALHLEAKPEYDSALIGFTDDGKLALGLALSDERPDVETRAKALMDELAREFGGILGLIREEEPPPANEAEFRRLGAAGGFVVFREY